MRMRGFPNSRRIFPQSPGGNGEKIEQVRAILKKRRNRSVAVGLIALFVSVAMFAVTILARYAFQNTEQYSVGWIKYFT